jgi:hypothetical protein
MEARALDVNGFNAGSVRGRASYYIISRISLELAAERCVDVGDVVVSVAGRDACQYASLLELLTALQQPLNGNFVLQKRKPSRHEMEARALDVNGFVARRQNASSAFTVCSVSEWFTEERNVRLHDQLLTVNGSSVSTYTNESLLKTLHGSLLTQCSFSNRHRSPLKDGQYTVTKKSRNSAEVTMSTPEAERSGIRRGDRVTHVNGVSTSQLSQRNLNDIMGTSSGPTAIGGLVHIDDDVVVTTVSAANHRRGRTYQTVSQQWDFDNPCPFCSYIYLKSVRKTQRQQCCQNGEALDGRKFPQLLPLPPVLSQLYFHRMEHMGSKSGYYNSVLALGATGVDNGKGGGWEKVRGDHSVKLCGRTYHYMPTTGGTSGIQFFCYDAATSLESYGDSLNDPTSRHGSNIVNTNLMKIYRELQQCNQLVGECEQIGAMCSDTIMQEGHIHELRTNINVRTNSFDVAAITSDTVSGDRIITFRLKNTNKAKSIPCTHELLEPLCYVLLFPYGESGWGSATGQSVKFPQYLLSRMLCPERDFENNVVRISNKHGTRQWPVNRFQCLSRVGQLYLTDMVSRGIDFRLNWHKINQNYIFGGGQQQGNDDNGGDQEEQTIDNSTSSSSSYLAQSFHGSRRHLRQKASEALVLVTELGTPTFFLTLTCNPMWPEIQEALLAGQTAFDRPDICCRVFKHRLDAFLHNLSAGKYFDSQSDSNDSNYVRREVVYCVRVIEYQFRGMPHVHIIIKLSNTPDPESPQDCSAFIDSLLSCQYPVLEENASTDDMLYQGYVKDFEVHHCAANEVNGCIDKHGVCKRGFMHTTIQSKTTFDERGHAIYKRLKGDDLRVVPHSKLALIDWGGHIFFDYCANAYTVLYLYKYLFKGSKKVKLRLDNAADVDDKDEITLYLRGRYLCSTDAMWRTLGYQTYPSPKPAVRTIKAMMPEASGYFREKQKISDIEIYFARPASLHDLLYTEFNRQYIASYELTDRRRRDPESYYTLNIPELKKELYLFRRHDSRTTLVRMEMLYPSAGEVWYLRQLLLKKAFTSFEDCKCCNGEQYYSFQSSALAHGFVSENNDAMACFTEAAVSSTPPELRFVFTMLTLEGFPTHDVFYNHDCQAAMCADYYHRAEVIQSDEGRFNALLADLAQLFADRGAHLTDYAFPEPLEYKTELERERLLYSNAQEQLALLRRLEVEAPNNENQADVFRTVTQAMDITSNGDDRSKLYFLQGQGGCGKTTVAKKLMAYARSKSLLALGCASTALAATNYEGFTTAHSLFCYPVIDDTDDMDPSEPAQCQFDTNPERWELLTAAVFIVWDEMPSNHRQLFEAVYRATDGFKGKVLLCMGDWRQIMPIVKSGSREEVVDSCIKRSYLWNEFTVLNLSINMRLRALGSALHNSSDTECADYEARRDAYEQQTDYGDMILSIGEGTCNHKDVDLLNKNDYDATQICRFSRIPFHLASHNKDDVSSSSKDVLQSALTWLHPDGFNSETMSHSCILAARNDTGDMWNKLVQEMNPDEQVVSYASRDKLCEVDDPNGILQKMMTTEVLNQFNNNGMPPHILALKRGDICLVLRNMSKRNGLVTNRRVRVLQLNANSIKVQTIGDNPKVTVIPRIRFKFRLPYGESFQLMRTQFPLRLAYCMSYNKSQGQTFTGKVLMDVTSPPFAHGHLYVALSRITLHSNINIVLNADQLFDDAPTITNTTYPELL